MPFTHVTYRDAQRRGAEARRRNLQALEELGAVVVICDQLSLPELRKVTLAGLHKAGRDLLRKNESGIAEREVVAQMAALADTHSFTLAEAEQVWEQATGDPSTRLRLAAESVIPSRAQSAHTEDSQ